MKHPYDVWKEEYLAKQAKIEAANNAIKNPCIKEHGPGPSGQKCRDCFYLAARKFSKTYYKCLLRKETRGVATDHRVNWEACAKFKME